MNFLAHLYLSGSDENQIIGGFIADAVKGKDYKNYSAGIQKGILLHRSIDTFTDNHPVTHSCNHLFRQLYHKHAGVVIDIVFDHYLAINWENFSCIPLEKFIDKAYMSLSKNVAQFPEEIQAYLPRMIEANWLLQYRELDGIEIVLSKMPLRTTLPNEAVAAMKIIRGNYHLLRNYFFEFFPQVKSHAENEIVRLNAIHV